MQKTESSPDLTRKRYNRIAFLYDLMEAPMERLRFSSWRQKLMGRIAGPAALEVGVWCSFFLGYPLLSEVALIFYCLERPFFRKWHNLPAVAGRYRRSSLDLTASLFLLNHSILAKMVSSGAGGYYQEGAALLLY